MKTEKRLTMALSVLVALMMLAVPLASSSNLFVDGGQTNSNGDAPLLGENVSSASGNILEVWIIDSQASLDKINDYDSRGSKYFTDGANGTDGKWKSSNTPWLAIAYIYSDGMNLSVKYDKNGTSTPLTWDNNFLLKSNKEAGKQYVLVADLNGTAAAKDLELSDSTKYYQTYDLELKVGSEIKGEGSFNYLNNAGYYVGFDMNILDESLDTIDLAALANKINTSITDKNKYYFSYGTEGFRAVVNYSNVTIGELIGVLSAAIASGKTGDMRAGYVLGESFSAENEDYTASSNELVDGDMKLTASWTFNDKDYILVKFDAYQNGESLGIFTKAYVKETSQTYHEIKVDKDLSIEDKFDLKGYVVNNAPNANYEYSDKTKGTKPGIRDVFGLAFTFNGKAVADGTKVYHDSIIKLDYDLKDDYYTIDVYSKMFEKSVTDGIATLYAFNTQPATFDQIFTALQKLDNTGGLEGKTKLLDVKPIDNTEYYQTTDNNWKLLDFIAEDDLKYSLNNNKYTINDVNYEDGRSFELEAVLAGYQVIFMVNGQYDVVNVAYDTKWGKSDLSTMTDLDLEGVKNWVAVYSPDAGSLPASYNGYAVLKDAKTLSLANFKSFNFSSTEIRAVEDDAKGTLEGQDFALVLVANFQDADKTSYAIFDANDYSGTLTLAGADKTFATNGMTKTQVDTTDNEGTKLANFGNELVTKIIISGKTGDSISTLPANPVILDSVKDKDKFLYLNWFLHTNVGSDNVLTGFLDTSNNFSLNLGKFGVGTDEKTDGVDYISADWEKYKNTITFHADGKVNGIFYYRDVNDGDASKDDIKDIYDLVAFLYNDKLYPSYLVSDDKDKSSNMDYVDSSNMDYVDYTNSDISLAATDAFAHVLDPFKAGNYLEMWTDAPSNGNKMIDDVSSVYIERSNKPTEYITHEYLYQWFDKLTESADFYANFLPLGYRIAYNSNSADAPNSVYQIGFADVDMKLLGEKTFSNDKSSTLTSWNDRSDNAGKTYVLGADFKLTGEQLDAMGITAYNTDMKYFADKEAGQTIPAGSEGITGDLTFFGIWAFNTDGGSGDSSSGGDDNTNTYILIGILLVIIILIIVMIVLMRNKN